MYAAKLGESIDRYNSRLCIELGFAHDRMLPGYDYTPDSIVSMVRKIIDVGCDTVPAYKIDPDMYYMLGSDSNRVVHEIVSYIRKEYPHKVLIADLRIAGNAYTIQKYRRHYLEGPDKFDAITMFPYPDETVLPYIMGEKQEHGLYLIVGTEDGHFMRFRNANALQNIGFGINGSLPHMYMYPTLEETGFLTLMFGITRPWYSDATLYGGGDLGLVNCRGYVKAEDLPTWDEHLGHSYSEARYLINDNLRTRARLAALVKDLKKSEEGSGDGIIYDHYKKNVDREWGSWNYDGSEWTTKNHRSLFPPMEVLKMFGIKSNLVQLSTFSPQMLAVFIANAGNNELRERIATGQVSFVNIAALFDCASAMELGYYLGYMPSTLFRSA